MLAKSRFWHPSAERVRLSAPACSLLSPWAWRCPLWSSPDFRSMSCVTLSATVRGKIDMFNRSNRKQIARCPHPLAAYSEKWLQALLSGAGKLSSPAGNLLGRTEGKQVSALSLHTHTIRQSLLDGAEAIIHTSNKVSGLPYAPGGMCLLAPPWLQNHLQSRAVQQRRIKSLADSSAIWLGLLPCASCECQL